MKALAPMLAFLLAAAASSADAAVVRLKDGGRVEGTVVSATAQEVVIQTAGGPRRIDADRIQSIEYETPPAPSPAPAAAPVGSGEIRSAYEEKNLISFGLGLAAPLSSVDFGSIGGGSANHGDLGPLIGIRYLRGLTRRFAAGVDFEYFHRGGTHSPGLLPLADASVTGDNLLLMGVGRWHILDHGAVRPYLLGGAGVSRSWTRIEAAPIPGFAWTDTNTDEARRLVDDGVWALAGTAQAGVDFDWEFAEPAVFSLEAGWTGLQRKRYGATVRGRELGLESVRAPLNLFMIAARWSVRW